MPSSAIRSTRKACDADDGGGRAAGHRVRVQRRAQGRIRSRRVAESPVGAGSGRRAGRAGSPARQRRFGRHGRRLPEGSAQDGHTLADEGFTGGAAQLRRGQLAQSRMAGPTRVEALTRTMMEGYARSGGTLGDGVLELATGRHFNIQPYRRALPPYPELEWRRLTDACRRLVDDSYAAHRRALTALRAGTPPPRGWIDLGELLLADGTARPGRHTRGRSSNGPVAQGISPTRGRGLPHGVAGCVPAPGCGDRLPAAVRHLLGHRARRHRRPRCRRHRLGRRLNDPAVLSQAPHRRGEPEPTPLGGAVTGALGAAAQPGTGHPHRPAVAGIEPTRQPPPDRQGRPGRHPTLGAASRRHRRRRSATEDPPGAHPHHASRDAQQEQLDRKRPRHDRSTPPRSKATTT